MSWSGQRWSPGCRSPTLINVRRVSLSRSHRLTDNDKEHPPRPAPARRRLRGPRRSSWRAIPHSRSATSCAVPHDILGHRDVDGGTSAVGHSNRAAAGTRMVAHTPLRHTPHPHLGAPRIPMHDATMHPTQLAAVYVRGAASRASSCAPEAVRAVFALSASCTAIAGLPRDPNIGHAARSADTAGYRGRGPRSRRP